ncbi:hypothetical protein HALLA_16250 [Halostagnicola larsenii XH-48]|uniref:Uncharacterized protein n=1 Tax=Halostagnicola larsenii XH-48 TaxID=797299 RepID=W0JND7_9EURY|nr:hypothetical protein [Halostagnicola larsenii]AHG00119.1 hypothetical protein HALLA_16250 [Halostagnicola larsenii XH-48]
MVEDAIVRRLNIVIVLLVAVLGILVWPLLPSLILLVGVGLFLVLGGALVWSLIRGL